jgi:glycosyltransferase involved in cell wall biosynthesis
MKICFIVEDYCFNGGGERILTWLCNELADHYDITILSLLETKNESNYSLDKKIKIKFAHISRLCWGGFTKSSELCYLSNNISYLEKFDMIIGLGIVINILLGILSDRIKNKKIGWVHTSYNREGSCIFKVFRYIFYRKIDLLVILTQYDYKKYTTLNRNVVVINNFFPERKEKIEYPAVNKKFIFAGRIDKCQKGIDILCKILKEYYSANDFPWKFKIIGDGKDKEMLVRFLQKNNLTKYIELLSNTSQMEKEYRQASCLVCTSRFEGFPMVLLEASSFGLPIISFDCPTGPSEIIKDDFNGFLIKPNDIKQFVKRMLELQNNVEMVEYFSVNTYNLSEKFLAQNIIPQWKNILND